MTTFSKDLKKNLKDHLKTLMRNDPKACLEWIRNNTGFSDAPEYEAFCIKKVEQLREVFVERKDYEGVRESCKWLYEQMEHPKKKSGKVNHDKYDPKRIPHGFWPTNKAGILELQGDYERAIGLMKVQQQLYSHDIADRGGPYDYDACPDSGFIEQRTKDLQEKLKNSQPKIQ